VPAPEKESDVKKSAIYELIVKLDFPIIYTTNYDPFLETAFDHHGKAYRKIRHVSDFVYRDRNTTEIVKYHGDLEDEKSIVLTETSYFERLDFETALDIKIRADVLGRTVLFIGYSLRDINIRYLFHRLTKLWRFAASGTKRPKSFVFLSRPNAVQKQVLENHKIYPLVSDVDSPKVGLQEFLEVLVSRVGM